MGTFLEFINEKRKAAEGSAVINEAFKTEDVDKAHKLMLKLFKDTIGKNVVMIDCPVATKVDGKDCISITFFVHNGNNIDVAWNLNYLSSGKSAEVYSIDFFTGQDAEAMLFSDKDVKSALSIYTMGQSVAYFLPLIIDVAKTKDFDMSKAEAEKSAKKVFANEAKKYYIGAQAYTVFESLDNNIVENAFHISQGHHLVNNGTEFIWETEADDVKKKVRAAEKESWKTKNDSTKARERSLALDREYREICKAINGGATTLKDIEISIGHKVSVMYDTDESTKDVQKKVDEAEKEYKKDPEQAFKEMQGYVKTVIKGLQPGVILCGAPGVGKTYRVLQQLKANGYQHGKNLAIIKGKATPRQLYLTLYDYKSKGDMILIDDADSLVGPKAPEDVINILKAALDSTSDDEGRLVSYKISGKLEDDEGNPVPKEMYFNGSVIVITNYDVSSLDSAIKNRVFVQSLSFSTKQLLDIIKKIMPAIAPQKLSPASKMKAYDYLVDLADKGANMEISIRSFTTCARLFQVCEGDPDFNDDDAKSMIAEQMENQFKTGGRGKKF